VTPNQNPTNQTFPTYRFEYGTSTSYGFNAPVPDGRLGSETTAEEVHQIIGVAPGRTYHFRLAATTLNGVTTYSEDRTFTTPPVSAPTYASSVGSLGSAGGQFSTPIGVAIDSKHNLWVADSGNSRIEEFSAEGKFVAAIGWGVTDGKEELERCTEEAKCLAGRPGSGQGQLNGPSGIAIGPGDNVFVGDGTNGRVEEFSSTGAYVTHLGPNGALGGPGSVAVAPNGDVWVDDPQLGRIAELAPNPKEPKEEVIRTVGGFAGTPSAVAVDAKENVWVVDLANHVTEFSPNGEFMRQFGTTGSGNGQLNSPASLSIGEKGEVWVTDSGNNRVEEFTSVGEYIAQFGSGGSGTEQFSSPWGIAVAGGAAYIGDRGNNRVERWNVSE